MDNGTCCRFPEWGREVVRTFFLPSLNLFYDYTTGDSFEHRFDHLPKPEEIAAETRIPAAEGAAWRIARCMPERCSMLRSDAVNPNWRRGC